MKPILCSTPQVQALLNTKPDIWPPEPIDQSKPLKSQTRRVVSIASNEDCHESDCGEELHAVSRGYGVSYERALSPRYKPGDILWVRETWCELSKLDDNDQPIDGTNKYYFAADGRNPTPFNYFLDNHGNPDPQRDCPRWKPSIHMPREAARLFLEVKSVRVERLQDITEADAKAEGIDPARDLSLARKLWDTLNAKRGYSGDSNPWVWVYEFMRLGTFHLAVGASGYNVSKI